jgi:hypothetical protein
MPEILEQEQSIRVPTAPPTRSRAIEFTLAILGFLCLGAGAYLLFALEDWWLGDLADAWHLGAFIIGGVLVMTGLGVYANESYLEEGRWSARVITGAVVALLALAGAVAAALFLIF